MLRFVAAANALLPGDVLALPPGDWDTACASAAVGLARHSLLPEAAMAAPGGAGEAGVVGQATRAAGFSRSPRCSTPPAGAGFPRARCPFHPPTCAAANRRCANSCSRSRLSDHPRFADLSRALLGPRGAN